MSLPKRAPKPIVLDDVIGLAGKVYVRPWTKKEFKAIEPVLQSFKMDDDWMDKICSLIADRLVTENGEPIAYDPADWDDYEAPTLADLYTQICDRCGFARREQIVKN